MLRKLLAALFVLVALGVCAGVALADYEVTLVKDDGSANVPITQGQELSFDFSGTAEFPARLHNVEGFTYSLDSGATKFEMAKKPSDREFGLPITITNGTKISLVAGADATLTITPTSSVTMTVKVGKVSTAAGPSVSTVKKLPEPVKVTGSDMTELGVVQDQVVKISIADASALVEFYSQATFDVTGVMTRTLRPWTYGGVSLSVGNYTYTVTSSMKGQVVSIRAKPADPAVPSKVTITFPNAVAASGSIPSSTTTAPSGTTVAPSKTLPSSTSVTTPPDTSECKPLDMSQPPVCPNKCDKRCGPGGPAKPLSGFSGVIAWLRSLLPW